MLYNKLNNKYYISSSKNIAKRMKNHLSLYDLKKSNIGIRVIHRPLCGR